VPAYGPRMIHPWRRLRQLSHITLLWADDGPAGETDFEASTITLRRGMSQAERRSTVLHECLHAERGPVPMGLAAREELRVWKEQARLLLPDVKLVADALAWAQGDVVAAADELWVCEDTLRVRLKHMHPSERGWMRARLETESEETA
jgi:hypothetical protein